MTSNPTLKNFFHPVTQYLLQNHQKCQIIFCPTHQQQNRFLPGWLSLLLVYGQSCLTKLLPIIFPSTKKTTLTLLLPLLHLRLIFLRQSLSPTPTWTTKGSNLIISPLQNLLCHPLSSPHEKFAKPFSSLTPPNPKALMVFQQQFSKPVLLNLPLFLTNYSSFPTLLAHFPARGNKPTSFLSQKKATSLIHSTIVPLQSLHSSLKLWRTSSLSNFLPSLKQTIFSLITSMAFEKPGLLAIFLLMQSMSGIQN